MTDHKRKCYLSDSSKCSNKSKLKPCASCGKMVCKNHRCTVKVGVTIVTLCNQCIVNKAMANVF